MSDTSEKLNIAANELAKDMFDGFQWVTSAPVFDVEPGAPRVNAACFDNKKTLHIMYSTNGVGFTYCRLTWDQLLKISTGIPNLADQRAEFGSLK